MVTTEPCVFCWTIARHSWPDEFHNLQQRVVCPTCGTYRLSERSHQCTWDLVRPALEHALERSPLPRALSKEIRRRYDESGGHEVVIDQWERFRNEAIARYGSEQ